MIIRRKLPISLLSLLCWGALLICFARITPIAHSAESAELPPGWLPVNRLDDKVAWSDFRKDQDKVHLYLPAKVDTVRGVFVCYVFHSSDPRELADLWQFALVTVPWPFEYDLGHNDKRNGRYKLGHPLGNTGVLIKYLEVAAKETKHPELAVAPIVGWVGQNGSHICADLYKRAPDRVLAWADAFPNRIAQFPELTKQVPFAFAWEFSANEGKERLAAREKAGDAINDQLTPPPDFRCRANTYGFSHGIYSKYNFFAMYLDRCIQLRLPAETPPPGQATKLKPLALTAGWAGDYNHAGEWAPIATVDTAKGMVAPGWLPDEYAAWAWRSYHSNKPRLSLSEPKVEYSKTDGKWGGPRCGLGYGGDLPADKPVSFAADSKGEFAKVEFHDGDKIVGSATAAPWTADGIKLDRGLRVLFAVGVTADGKREASRPAFVIVK